MNHTITVRLDLTKRRNIKLSKGKRFVSMTKAQPTCRSSQLNIWIANTAPPECSPRELDRLPSPVKGQAGEPLVYS